MNAHEGTVEFPDLETRLAPLQIGEDESSSDDARMLEDFVGCRWLAYDGLTGAISVERNPRHRAARGRAVHQKKCTVVDDVDFDDPLAVAAKLQFTLAAVAPQHRVVHASRTLVSS